jgi:hypothetical protein
VARAGVGVVERAVVGRAAVVVEGRAGVAVVGDVEPANESVALAVPVRVGRSSGLGVDVMPEIIIIATTLTFSLQLLN